VPIKSFDLNASSKRNTEADSSQSTFMPRINKKSAKMAEGKREGKIEEHLLKQA